MDRTLHIVEASPPSQAEWVPQNLHHVWFPRREYRHPLEKMLRRHPAFIVRGPVDWHEELHANVMVPPKLLPELTYDMIEDIGEIPIGGTLGIQYAMRFLRESRDYDRPRRADVAGVAFEALSQQLHYLHGNHVLEAANG